MSHLIISDDKYTPLEQNGPTRSDTFNANFNLVDLSYSWMDSDEIRLILKSSTSSIILPKEIS